MAGGETVGHLHSIMMMSSYPTVKNSNHAMWLKKERAGDKLVII